MQSHPPFQKVILFSQRRQEKSVRSTLIELKNLLEQKLIQVFIEEQTAVLFDLTQIKNINIISEHAFASTAELIIVVGGDGSLLSAARLAVLQNLPVVGINKGRLGFLADIAPNNFLPLEEIISGHYYSEKRFLLETRIMRQGEYLQSFIALNDVVLLPGEVAHMIEFTIAINQEFMCLQRADGLIITTPTGSTAYALSGGGPILHPQLEAIAIVPMFPHKLTSRPIVIDSSSEIHLTIMHQPHLSPRISSDGQIQLTLLPEDAVYIQKFAQSLTLIHPLSYQYYSTLRSKLQWENKSC